MPLKLHDSLAQQLVIAHRIVETVVVRSRAGEVFTIEIGTPLSPKTGPAYGAKVTQVSPQQRHIAVCLGSTMAEVFEIAQRHIGETLGVLAPTGVSRRAA
jgi:hypothetical protein